MFNIKEKLAVVSIISNVSPESKKIQQEIIDEFERIQKENEKLKILIDLSNIFWITN
jgi:hypothetical protein